jgi:hypothetical protein
MEYVSFNTQGGKRYQLPTHINDIVEAGRADATSRKYLSPMS